MPEQSGPEPPPSVKPSEYIAFGDESGDHGPSTSRSRAFVIVIAIFRRDDYTQYFVPALREFKRRCFGDEDIILHERDVRRGDGAFRRLRGLEERARVVQLLRLFVAAAPFRLAAVGYHKDRYQPSELEQAHPYDLPVVMGLLAQQAAMPHTIGVESPTELVFDARGAVEDGRLAETIRAVAEVPPMAEQDQGDLQFNLRFVSKSEREAGVELADLVANPIASEILGEPHPLIPFEILEPKFLRHPSDPTRFALIRMDAR